MEAPNKTPQGKARIAKMMDRSDRYLAEHIRRAEVKSGSEAHVGGVVMPQPCQLRRQPSLHKSGSGNFDYKPFAFCCCL